MTYATGNVILASDFNGFSSNINGVWNTMYGQTVVTTVATGNAITAAQWSSLNTVISNTAAHQGTTITSRTNPVVGDTISVLPNLSTDIASCVTNQYNAYAQGTQYTAWTGSASKTTATGSGSSAWTITFTDTVTFANTTAATQFFNAGGTIKIQFSKSSTGTAADTEWNNFVNNVCGAIYLSSTATSKTINGQTYTGTTKIGGSGTPTILRTDIGYAQLTSSPTTIYQQFDSGYSYSSNYIRVTATASAGVITFSITWYDNGDTSPGHTANISGGSATTGISFGTAPATVVTYFPPETNYLTNSWGTPTVVSSVA